MLQGKPFLPPAAIGHHRAAAREPGAGLGCRAAVCPEGAVPLRSSCFRKRCLAPFNWGGGIRVAETRVKEKKSLKWYNEQWACLEGLFP